MGYNGVTKTVYYRASVTKSDKRTIAFVTEERRYHLDSTERYLRVAALHITLRANIVASKRDKVCAF